MDVKTKLEFVRRGSTEEIVTEKHLKSILETTEHPRHYIGFEISGLLHLGTLILSGYKINDLVKAGIDCRVFLADWHSVVNNKFGGDWNLIAKAAKYYQKAFKFFCPGVKIIHGSEL